MSKNKSKTKYYSEHEISTDNNNLILKNSGKEVIVTSEKNSSSPDDGSFNTEGGVGIKKDLNVGGSISLGGEISAETIRVKNIYNYLPDTPDNSIRIQSDASIALYAQSILTHETDPEGLGWQLFNGNQFIFHDHDYGNPNPPGPPFVGNEFFDIPFQFYGDTTRAVLKLSNKNSLGDGIYFLHGGLGSATRDVNYFSAYYTKQSMNWSGGERTFTIFMPPEDTSQRVLGNGDIELGSYTITVKSHDRLRLSGSSIQLDADEILRKDGKPLVPESGIQTMPPEDFHPTGITIEDEDTITEKDWFYPKLYCLAREEINEKAFGYKTLSFAINAIPGNSISNTYADDRADANWLAYPIRLPSSIDQAVDYPNGAKIWKVNVIWGAADTSQKTSDGTSRLSDYWVGTIDPYTGQSDLGCAWIYREDTNVLNIIWRVDRVTGLGQGDTPWEPNDLTEEDDPTITNEEFKRYYARVNIRIMVWFRIP